MLRAFVLSIVPLALLLAAIPPATAGHGCEVRPVILVESVACIGLSEGEHSFETGEVQPAYCAGYVPRIEVLGIPLPGTGAQACTPAVDPGPIDVGGPMIVYCSFLDDSMDYCIPYCELLYYEYIDEVRELAESYRCSWTGEDPLAVG